MMRLERVLSQLAVLGAESLSEVYLAMPDLGKDFSFKISAGSRNDSRS